MRGRRLALALGPLMRIEVVVFSVTRRRIEIDARERILDAASPVAAARATSELKRFQSEDDDEHLGDFPLGIGKGPVEEQTRHDDEEEDHHADDEGAVLTKTIEIAVRSLLQHDVCRRRLRRRGVDLRELGLQSARQLRALRRGQGGDDGRLFGVGRCIHLDRHVDRR